jgi:hypothetical protein
LTIFKKDGKNFRQKVKLGNYLRRGKGMVLNVQLSTNCELGCFRNKTKYFSLHQQPIFSVLTTTQAIDPLSLYRDFPGKTLQKFIFWQATSVCVADLNLVPHSQSSLTFIMQVLEVFCYEIHTIF